MLVGQNAAYASLGVDQVGSVLRTFVLRSVPGVASHAMYTAIFAAGVIYLVGTPAQPRRVGRGLLLSLGAMVVHGSWDSMAALADGNGFAVTGLMLLITATSVAILLLALRWGSARERGYLRDVLAPEAEAGVLTDRELAALTGKRHRRRDRRAARREGLDRAARRREKHVLAGALDLVHDLSESGGAETPDVIRSRAEIARLRAR
ncbi:PrsW family glutamic-type intramembrane protease [Cellulomonas pakistanensis]|nr:PrsW family glutamic-type intramembrane protease [Cellulomonas pakistanensis]